MTLSAVDLLVPRPRRIEVHPGWFALDEPVVLRPPPRFDSPALERLRMELEQRGVVLGAGPRAIELVLDGRSGHPREGYALTIDPGLVRVVASRRVGLDHGLRTLAQLVRVHSWPAETGPLGLPALAIDDA